MLLMFLIGVGISALFYMWLHKYEPSMNKMVYDFTSETNNYIPEYPIPLNKKETIFLSNMIISEVVELLQSFDLEMVEIEKIIIEAVGKDLSDHTQGNTQSELLGEQVDACVDIIYYILNGLNKKGINIYPFFQEVHSANMRKKINGKFIKRSDGKIEKPPLWKGPDMTKVAMKLMHPVH